MVTRNVDKVPEPRLQIGRTGVPFFGRDVEKLAQTLDAFRGLGVGAKSLLQLIELFRIAPRGFGEVEFVSVGKRFQPVHKPAQQPCQRSNSILVLVF